MNKERGKQELQKRNKEWNFKRKTWKTLSVSPWYGVTCNKLSVSIKRVTGAVDCGVDCSRLLPVAPLGNCKSIGSVPPGSCPSVPDIPLIVTPAPLPFKIFFAVHNVNDDVCWWTLTRDDFLTREICSLIQQFTMRFTLRGTLSQSVLPGYRCVQHDMLRTKRDLTNSAGNKLWSGSEPWYRYVYRAQAHKQGLRITRNNQIWPIRYIKRVAQREKNNQDAATSATPQCLQPICHPSKFHPRTMRVRGTIQVRLSFLIDGFLTAPSQL